MLNPFFLQGSKTEQSLIQDLINEQLRMYGVEVYYIPRKYITKKSVIKEVIQSKFDQALPIEAYVNTYDGYEGQGTILSKFGIQSLTDLTVTISRERFENYITPLIKDRPNIELATRPKEGDLLWFPLGDRLFEIKFVEHEQPFYQLQKTYVYELKCELFRYEDEELNTDVDEIDDNILTDGYTQTLRLVGVGTTAAATGFVSSGIITSVQITNGGFGYDQDNPPQVIVEVPQPKRELITNIANVQGFSGIITGITTTTGTGGHPLALKIFFRATKPNGLSAEPDANDLQVGYPIAIFDTKVGNGVTSVDGNNSSIVGIGTTFIDNVYIVHSKTNVGPDAEIICNIHTGTAVTGISTFGSVLNPLGRFSWGRLYNLTRGSNPIAIGVTGLVVDSGLSTFATIQRRKFGFKESGAIRDQSATDTVS